MSPDPRIGGSVLIANRGEIACRIIRTARRLSLRTIAVYSEVDADAQHTVLADEAHEIGPAPASESYLHIGKIIRTAKAAGADYIHPGYGFLAENAEFASAVLDAGLTFVGPSPEAIRVLGEKEKAKQVMAAAGLPVTPGFPCEGLTQKQILARCKEVGFPVMLKPVAGGGGKGMRRVDNARHLKSKREGAEREAAQAFGDHRIMVEKLIDRPRHIEVQIFADNQGNVLHLFERDCSLQRRYQKVIEESPAPGLSDALREQLFESAIQAAKAVGYSGAGTVEFLVEQGSPKEDASFYFMEMNTRLQVEHPVTECITGLDLVEWQLRVAAGEPLPLTQTQLSVNGHAIEARIYAEDPASGFLPSSGHLYALEFPNTESIRIDSGLTANSDITPHYDPLIAKLIAHGKDREQTLRRLNNAIGQTLIAGPKTNLAFLSSLLSFGHVADGHVDTGLIERHLAELTTDKPDPAAIVIGALALLDKKSKGIEEDRLAFSEEHESPWSATDGFQLANLRRLTRTMIANGKPHSIHFKWTPEGPVAKLDESANYTGPTGPDDGAIRTVETEKGVLVLHNLRQTELTFPDQAGTSLGDEEKDGFVHAPMHGKITSLLVTKGSKVSKGDRLAVLEAMKMEHVLQAPYEGIVKDVAVKAGDQVEEGTLVLVVEKAEVS